MRTISVQQGLNDLKVIQARLERALTEVPFGTLSEGGNIRGWKSVDVYVNAAQSAFDSASALIDNYAELKSKIIQSNAVTKIVIAGEELTVAEAIERKKSIDLKRKLLNVLTSQHSTIMKQLTTANDKVKKDAEAQAAAFFNGKAEKTSAEYTEFVTAYIERNGVKTVDPLRRGQNTIETHIARLQEYIEAFTSQVDLAIVGSNVTTQIEISF